MLFKAPVLSAIAEGQVTLAFRRWRKPTVRSGGTLTTLVRVLGIDTVEIADHPGRETLPFKTDVRKLKALGLTQSLEIGYRLSPRGEALLAARRSGG